MRDPATVDPGQFVVGERQRFDLAAVVHDLAARRA